MRGSNLSRMLRTLQKKNNDGSPAANTLLVYMQLQHTIHLPATDGRKMPCSATAS